MANFSQDPATVLTTNQAKGYVGVHIEQGVPVLDRDLNLINDLVSATVRSVLAGFIGNGVANNSSAFLIVGEGNANDFLINGPGVCLVNGWEVRINAAMQYSAQAGVDPLTTPVVADRQDLVYLDVWTSEVTGETDADLLNNADVGMQTSVRRLLNWRVHVAEGGPIPAPAPGHVHYQLATMIRPATAEIEADALTDERQTRLNLAAMEQRLRVLEQRLFAPTFGATEFIPPAGGPGTQVRIFGTNFDVGTPHVFFGTAEATLDQFSAEEIRSRVPTIAPGQVHIRVVTDGGSVTSQNLFQVQ